MLILGNDLTQDSGASMLSSTVAAAMPASNLRTLQISERTRLTDLTGDAHIGLSMTALVDPVIGFDTVAVIGYDGTPTRNMLRNQASMDAGSWTVNLGTLLQPYSAPPAGLPVRVQRYTTSSAGSNYIEQTLLKPDAFLVSNAAMDLRTGIIVNQVIHDADLKIDVEDSSGSHNAQVTFDLSAGTAGTPTDAGNFTAGAAEITDLGGGWYWCRLAYQTDATDTLVVRCEFTGFSAGSQTIDFAVPVTMLQSADWTLAEYPLHESDGTGPMFHLYLSGPNSEVAWQHAARRNHMKGFPRFGFFHKYASAQFGTALRVSIWDRYNPLLYNEMGRLIVGTAISSDCVSFHLGADETGSEYEADGGQIFRPQNTVRRTLPFTLRYLTRAAAFDDYYYLQRIQGRSRQVLFIAEEGDDFNTHDGMVYGSFDSLAPLPVAGTGGVYEWRGTIKETP